MCLMWLTNAMPARLTHNLYRKRLIDTAQMRALPEARTADQLPQIDTQLTSRGGLRLLADTCGSSRTCVAVLCRWVRGLPLQPTCPLSEHQPLSEASECTPHMVKAIAVENLPQPAT